jgi:hypothetical protein
MKKGRGRRRQLKAKGPLEKLAPLHLIPKKHVSDTSHQINSSYWEKNIGET